MATEPKYDPETGEVLEDEQDPTATVDFGNGPIDMDDKEAMEQGAQEFVGKVTGAGQLTLFEGHKVDLFEVKLKAANMGSGIASADMKIPRLYERRFFVIEAQAVSVGHAKKVIGDEPVLMRTIKFGLTAGKEIDELTAKRFLKKDEA
jgi:hypothetical protein